ncbi:uncharacterized protein LOC119649018 [Hermetia illucens]|nr:uncharacterized protein LOC119649018 [Hermetia illucens]
MIMIIFNVKHSAFVALLIATALIGIVNGRQSRIMRFQPETQLSTAVRSSPPPSSSLSPTDDSWFSWANWRSILLRNGESQAGESRTFGLKRRLQMALIPLVFKFGVISTLIFILVALGLKTVFLLKTLLILNLAGIIAKLFIWKSELTSSKNQVTYSQWVPPIPPHFAPPHHEELKGKEVHLHIHNVPHNDGHGGWEQSNSYHHETHLEPYGGYSNPAPSYAHPTQRRSFKKIPISFHSR